MSKYKVVIYKDGKEDETFVGDGACVAIANKRGVMGKCEVNNLNALETYSFARQIEQEASCLLDSIKNQLTDDQYEFMEKMYNINCFLEKGISPDTKKRIFDLGDDSASGLFRKGNSKDEPCENKDEPSPADMIKELLEIVREVSKGEKD